MPRMQLRSFVGRPDTYFPFPAVCERPAEGFLLAQPAVGEGGHRGGCLGADEGGDEKQGSSNCVSAWFY